MQVEYISPAPAVSLSPALGVESFAPAAAVSLSPEPVVESSAPAPAGVRIDSASHLVFPTSTTRASSASACGGVYCTRASGDPIASACRGIHLTRAGCVPNASASRGAFLTCASCVSCANRPSSSCSSRGTCWRSTRLFPQDRVPQPIVEMGKRRCLGSRWCSGRMVRLGSRSMPAGLGRCAPPSRQSARALGLQAVAGPLPLRRALGSDPRTPDDFGFQDQNVIVVEEMIEEDERRRTSWTRSKGPGLVSPLGSCPCGCAAGSLPAGVGVNVRPICELHPHARGHGA